MTFGTEPPPSSGDDQHDPDQDSPETRPISAHEPGPTPGYGAPPPPPPPPPPAGSMPQSTPPSTSPSAPPPASPPSGYGPSSPGSYSAAPTGPFASSPGGPSTPPPTGQSFGSSLTPPTADQAKGFFAKLFDLSFSSFVTPSVVKVLYVVSIVLVVIGWLGYSIAAFRLNAFVGLLVLVIVGPLFALFWLILLRVTLELYIAVIRIAEDVRTLTRK